MVRSIRYGFVITFLWLGFVLAISFMEAWVKFRANIELGVALDVGRHVFAALNMVERLFAALTLVYIFYYHSQRSIVFLGIGLISILVGQSGYLLPRLNEHAVLIMQGMEPPQDEAHKMYIYMEVGKVLLLSVMGWKQVQLFRRLV
ncbi:MAG: hypothetical protein ACEPOZ_14015 [Marinifilaceae bacterium]